MAAVQLFPKALGQRQAGEILGLQPAIGFDAEALEYRGQLARVLGRVPGRAFVEHVHRLFAEEGLDRLGAGLVGEPVPPVLQARDDGLAVFGDLGALGERAVFRREVGQLHGVFIAFFRRFQESLADTEHVMAHQADGTRAVVDDQLVHAFIGHLAQVALCRAQHDHPTLDQFFRRQGFVAGAGETDEFRDVLEVLPEDEILAPGDDGNVADAIGQQAVTTRRVVEDIDGDEVDLFARKKLFRPETAASPRLGEEDELLRVRSVGRVGGGIHKRFILGARRGPDKREQGTELL